jgi:hypothetical protein
MNRFYFKICRNESGTALLVALLVMGVLIAISLTLSSLILRESVSTKKLIDSGRAYYAAESGIEEALYFLDISLPGWEGDSENYGVVGDLAAYEYEVKNKCNSYPCFDDDEYDVMPAYAYYGILELNENITIPLFTVDDEGKVDPVIDFTVEFFTNFSPTEDLLIENSAALSGWDVLRWKVFTLRNTEDGYITESLHDFTAVSSVKNIKSGEEFTSNAENPSWFGSKSCEVNDIGITCGDYAPALSSDGQACNNVEARDYYMYDEAGKEFEAKLSCYPIQDFMLRNRLPEDGGVIGSTGLNYLSLTNLMNPAMLKDDILDKKSASKIYFRVETYEKDTVREVANVVSDGYSGDVKQSIEVNMKRDSYMPVFNFSIYSTYGSDDGFYQDLNKPKLVE